jgi:hypothetical protein
MRDKLYAHLALDIPFLSSHPVLHPDTNNSVLATVSGTGRLVDLDHFRVVGHNRAMLDGGHNQGNVHSRIIVLAVVVDDTSNQAIGLEHWERLKGLSAAHPVGGFHVLGTGEEIVELASGVVVG